MTNYWQEDSSPEAAFAVPDDVVDLAFRISCRSLPLDHAQALSEALHAALPWLEDEPAAGIHLIHGAESGNGWERPSDPASQVLYPSRRTRLTLRLPAERVEEARALAGQTLELSGHTVRIGEADVRLFSILPTQFSRYVVVDDVEDETAFLAAVARELRALQVAVRKLLCGKSHVIGTPHGHVATRSVMVADLEPEEAIVLQRHGIGTGRKMGCGLFIPHKGIKPVNSAQE